MRHRLPATPLLVMVAWTVFLWLSRLRNVLGNDELTDWGTTWRIGVVVIFVVLAITAASGRLIDLFVWWTMGYWLVRGGGILIGDYSAGFKAIHTALMAVSIGLAMWVWRARNR